LLLAAGCATNPVTGRRELSFVSESREIQLGEKSYFHSQQAQGGAYEVHEEVGRYVESVVDQIVSVSDRSHLPFEIVVLNNSIPNAWAMPGGKMAVNRGLLVEMDSEAELAAVLAHEVVHVAARHGAKRIERGSLLQAGVLGLGLAVSDHDHQDIIMGAGGAGALLMTMKYSRGAELEADEYGVKYVSASGYDPAAAVQLQETFLRLSENKDPGWISGLLATHPPSQARIDANRKTAALYPAGGRIGREAYRAAIKPLLESAPAYESMEDGYKALKKQDYDDALSSARRALSVEPREAHFHALAAKAYIGLQNKRRAREEIDRAIELNDAYYEYHLLLGKLEHSEGRVLRARRALENSVALLPTASAHYLLGDIALGSGAENAAIQHFRSASSAKSSDGHKSRVMLARLEISEHPDRYLKISMALTGKGYLRVGLQNTSPVDVSVCRLSIYSTTTGRWQACSFPSGVPARRGAVVSTRVGPFPDVKTANASTRIRFDAVAVAGDENRRR
jgi:predicted Zn-dependent protease